MKTVNDTGPGVANAKTIYDYLVGQGLTPNAAAGILGNIAGESGGNPTAWEVPGDWSSGYGLIQWTPRSSYDPPATVTGQLPLIMKYIRNNGSVSDINAHAQSPASAASYFMTKYERPANDSSGPMRERVAEQVAASAKAGNLGNPVEGNSASANAGTIAAEGGGSNIATAEDANFITNLGEGLVPALGFAHGMNKIVTGATKSLLSFALPKQVETMLDDIVKLFEPSMILRIMMFNGGVVLLIVAIILVSNLGSSTAMSTAMMMPK